MKKNLMNGLYSNMSGEKEKVSKKKSEMSDMSNNEKELEILRTKEKIKNMVKKIQVDKDAKIEGLSDKKMPGSIIDEEASVIITSGKNKSIKETSKSTPKNEVKIEEEEIKMASENILNIEVPSKSRYKKKDSTEKIVVKNSEKRKENKNRFAIKRIDFASISGKFQKFKDTSLSKLPKLPKKSDNKKAKDKTVKAKKVSEKKFTFVSLKAKTKINLFTKRKIKVKPVEKNIKVKKAVSGNSIIVFDKVSKSFEGINVLKDFSIKIKKGESFVILGKSGVGKSVFIKIANGLLKPDKGSVSIFGKKIRGLFGVGLYKLNRDISFLFQGGALFDSMTVLENVAFGIIESQRIKKDIAFEIAREKLADVDLDADDIADKYPSELSGGMKKRVALARAIATNPKIIFFDEPTTGLDPITADIINDLIIKSVKKIGATAITITHDIHSTVKIADRVGLLSDGKIEWKGSVAELKKSKNENVKAFLKNL